MTLLRQIWDALRSVPGWAYAVAGWAAAYLAAVALRNERARSLVREHIQDADTKRRDTVDAARAEAAEKRTELEREHAVEGERLRHVEDKIGNATLDELVDILNTDNKP